MRAFFAMGGYAAYVWPAYGIVLLLLIIVMVKVYRKLAQAKKLFK